MNKKALIRFYRKDGVYVGCLGLKKLSPLSHYAEFRNWVRHGHTLRFQTTEIKTMPEFHRFYKIVYYSVRGEK